MEEREVCHTSVVKNLTSPRWKILEIKLLLDPGSKDFKRSRIACLPAGRENVAGATIIYDNPISNPDAL